jgi:hypothetical protein
VSHSRLMADGSQGFRFNIRIPKAGSRCDNTHMSFDRQSLTEDSMRPNAQTAQLAWPHVVTKVQVTDS